MPRPIAPASPAAAPVPGDPRPLVDATREWLASHALLPGGRGTGCPLVASVDRRVARSRTPATRGPARATAGARAHALIAGIAWQGLVLPVAMRTRLLNTRMPEGEWRGAVTGILKLVHDALPPPLQAHVTVVADPRERLPWHDGQRPGPACRSDEDLGPEHPFALRLCCTAPPPRRRQTDFCQRPSPSQRGWGSSPIKAPPTSARPRGPQISADQETIASRRSYPLPDNTR